MCTCAGVTLARACVVLGACGAVLDLDLDLPARRKRARAATRRARARVRARACSLLSSRREVDKGDFRLFVSSLLDLERVLENLAIASNSSKC